MTQLNDYKVKLRAGKAKFEVFVSAPDYEHARQDTAVTYPEFTLVEIIKIPSATVDED